MYDRYNRHIDYLRISVTDRCNLRCKYCMPDGIKWLSHDDILTYEEITEITRYLTKRGIRKVRLTGGEPLIRKDIIILVKMLSQIKEIEDLSMTTNGILLDTFAHGLKKAGLNRVNISLDTMDALLYNKITGGGNIKKVFDGIEAAKKVGLSPIKLNCVNSSHNTEKDVSEVKAFGKANDIQVRVIHQMNLHDGIFTTVEGGAGGNCNECNRIRLSSDGKLKPCLFSNQEYDIKKYGIEKALQLTLDNKPEKGFINHNSSFNQMGG